MQSTVDCVVVCGRLCGSVCNMLCPNRLDTLPNTVLLTKSVGKILQCKPFKLKIHMQSTFLCNYELV